jgi:hypothetical protein
LSDVSDTDRTKEEDRGQVVKADGGKHMEMKDSLSSFRLELLEVLGPGTPCDGDVRVHVSVDTGGFAGCNDEVWISQESFERFLTDLARIDQQLRGSAQVESFSKGEFYLEITASSSGRILAHGTLARTYYGPDRRPLTNSIQFEIELEATNLRSILLDLRKQHWQKSS